MSVRVGCVVCMYVCGERVCWVYDLDDMLKVASGYHIYITYISVYHSIIRAGSGKNFPHNAAPPPTHTKSRASVILPCGNAGACNCH